MYYECHITIALHPVSAKSLIAALNGWHFSCIEGDPVLKDHSYEYATRHASSNTPFEDVVAHMNRTADILRDQGFPVVRQKVELVMYDTKGKE